MQWNEGVERNLSSFFAFLKSIKIQFDDSKYEEKILELAEKINDKIEIINILQNVYSWIVMEDILSGYKYLSIVDE